MKVTVGLLQNCIQHESGRLLLMQKYIVKHREKELGSHGWGRYSNYVWFSVKLIISSAQLHSDHQTNVRPRQSDLGVSGLNLFVFDWCFISALGWENFTQGSPRFWFRDFDCLETLILSKKIELIFWEQCCLTWFTF